MTRPGIAVGSGWNNQLQRDEGLILRTRDGGDTWEKSLVSAGVWFNGASFSDSSVAVAVGSGNEEGIIYRTTNGGTNWAKLTKQTRHSLRAISFTGGGFGTVVGDRGDNPPNDKRRRHVVQSDWHHPGALYGVSFADATTGTAVGSGEDILGNPYGMILRTTDGGVSWRNRQAGPASRSTGSPSPMRTPEPQWAGDMTTTRGTTWGWSSARQMAARRGRTRPFGTDSFKESPSPTRTTVCWLGAEETTWGNSPRLGGRLTAGEVGCSTMSAVPPTPGGGITDGLW